MARLDTWYDAGIRDFFNAQVSTNSLMGALGVKGAPVRVWDGFPAIVGAARGNENAFDVNHVDWPGLGRHVYVRYGNPDVTQDVVEATGDGRHVGTATQAVHRAQSLLFFLGNRWPDGDRALATVDSANSHVMATFTAQGRPRIAVQRDPAAGLHPAGERQSSAIRSSTSCTATAWIRRASRRYR